MTRISFFASIVLSVSLFSPILASAADPSFDVRQTSVIIQCGDKQGSGVVVDGPHGYVLTNAHVLLNEKTNLPDSCEVGFITDETYTPKVFYRAKGVQYVYD